MKRRIGTAVAAWLLFLSAAGMSGSCTTDTAAEPILFLDLSAYRDVGPDDKAGCLRMWASIPTPIFFHVSDAPTLKKVA